MSDAPLDLSPQNEAQIAKLLIVDDRPENLIAMEKILSSAVDLQIEIHQASSGEEALSLVLDHDFAMILLDVQMPNMDGFEVASYLLSNARTAHIPVIFVTANNQDQKQIESAHSLGVVDYLFKPISPIILVSKVAVFSTLYRREQMLKQLLLKNQTMEEQLKKYNAELKELANYDVLTKLPNRLSFEDTIRETITTSNRYNRIFALLLIDLDNFKYVNDTYGHDVGDHLLQTVSDALSASFRDNDFVGRFGEEGFISRLGGDEFAIILDDLSDTNDAGVAAARAINEVSVITEIDKIGIHVGISVGIACFPGAGTDASTLYKNADAAMYSAKDAGKNTYQYYNQELHEKHLNRLSVENAINVGLEKEEFILLYQPIYELKNHQLTGIEALIRLNSSEIGEIMPLDFIPIAEQSGQIITISEWVFKTAFHQQKAWFNEGHQCHYLSLNLSSKQFLQNDLYRTIIELANNQKELINKIHLELTESTLNVDLTVCEAVLSSLKNSGFSISIDDFGTGSSSLLRLKNLPIDTIKIDQSFVKNINEDGVNQIIIKSIIELAKSLDLRVIAEGIETKEEYDYLVQQGCDQGQGFYLSNPISVPEMTKLLKQEEEK